MIYQKESSEFFQVFLSNKLSKQVQEAIKDQKVALGEHDYPVHYELLKSICLDIPRFLKLNLCGGEHGIPIQAYTQVLHESKLLAA